MNLADRIEKRRFVGREFLLWLWFASEVFEGTLSTEEHGSFGFFLEGQLVLSAGKESTRIRGASPGANREAKEALLRGKLPERAGLHLSLGADEQSFVLKAERMAIAGLSLRTVLDEEPGDEPALLAPPRRPRRKRAPDEHEVDDKAHESFYERMQLTRAFERVIEALYRDFLRLRLGPRWSTVVVPAMRAWVIGGAHINADHFAAEADLAARRDVG